MPEILNPLNVTVNTGGTITLPTVTSHNIFIFSGTSTLVSGYNIVPDSGAVEGMLFIIKWNAQVTYSGGNVVTIFGTALTQVQAVSELTVTCYYNGSSWEVDILVDAESLPNNYNGVETTTVPSGGGTVTLLTGTNKVTQHFIGTVTLSSSYTITAGGFPSNGDRFEIVWSAVCTLGVNSVTIFGISLDSIQALSGNVTVVATYNGSAWIAELIQGELKTNAVTNPMLAQMPTMTIKGNNTGGTANANDLTVAELKTMLGYYFDNAEQVHDTKYTLIASDPNPVLQLSVAPPTGTYYVSWGATITGTSSNIIAAIDLLGVGALSSGGGTLTQTDIHSGDFSVGSSGAFVGRCGTVNLNGTQIPTLYFNTTATVTSVEVVNAWMSVNKIS